MWAYSGMAPYIGPLLRLTSQSSGERPWRDVQTWQGPSGREEKQQAILARSFFLKPSDVILSASSCLLQKPHQHAFGSATQSGPSRAAVEPPSGALDQPGQPDQL